MTAQSGKAGGMTKRWRKQPNETGLARVVQSPRGYELREGNEKLIQVAPLSGKNRWDIIGWYWYGLGQNTYKTPVATPVEAKTEAIAWLKAHPGKTAPVSMEE